jgi:hypothetical protein
VNVEAKVNSEAREEQFRDALNRAWTAYSNAPPEEKDAAMERFRILLEDFAALVMPRRGRSDSP